MTQPMAAFLLTCLNGRVNLNEEAVVLAAKIQENFKGLGI